jgi:ResB-like family
MPMLLKRLIKIFTSLRLTVILLAFAILLVFIGTLAQVDEGLYNAQARYFRQWLIFGLDMFGRKIPIILPGGYLIGTMLLANLICAHVYRFQLSRKKIGIMLAHSGVILLLVGQLVTDMMAHETQMRFVEGETKSYSESPRNYELIFDSDDGTNGVLEVAFSDKSLVPGGEIKNANLPFTVRVKKFWINSDANFRAPMMTNAPPLATNGVAANFDFKPLAEEKTMDRKNVPTALIEIVGTNGSLGDWVVSDWTADEAMIRDLEETYTLNKLGANMVKAIITRLVEPQSIFAGGKKYTFALRPKRVVHQFSLTLLQTTHDIYPGTDIPKNFRSRVQLKNSQSGENREAEISMNHPLRYAGLTFYQFQMDASELAQQAGLAPLSALQVVRNPAWLTPYLGCALVAAGLVTQFMFHLVGFISKQKKK